MNRTLPLSVVALTAIGVAVAACSSSSGGGKSTPAIVVRGDGTAAQLSCNHSFLDPASTSTLVGSNIQTTELKPDTSTPPLPGVAVTLFNTSSQTLTGPTVVSDGSAIATMSAFDNTRFAVKGEKTGYETSYSLNFLAPAVGSTSGNQVMRMIPNSLFGAFIGFLNLTTADLIGKVQFAGAVADCTSDNAQLANVSISVPGAGKCTGNPPTLPCIAYIHGSLPSGSADATDNNGAFIIAGLPAGTPVTVTATGLVSPAGTPEPIGEFTLEAPAEGIALGITKPLAN